jgi:hypothetical protein
VPSACVAIMRPMDVGRPIAVGLAGLSLLGAEERIIAWALDGAGGDSSSITADAGPLSGTILPEQAEGGYVALGPRQRVDPIARRYHGGSFSDYV